MKTPHRAPSRFVHHLIFGLSLILAIPCSFSLAQAVTPITSSGLNTHIGTPTTLPGGETVYDITGGTRPGGGPNLYHSFGDFNVPSHTTANFLNDSDLATSNILGRVTDGNISNIFGTIQTTGFGNANLFLMNPAGFLFGPTATVNVGGMMTFTSANYLKLADGVRFNATPSASADLLLSTAPVAAFGFLGANPGAITVQGSQLSGAEGAGITLVGGAITVQAGTLTAPSGQINLVSVGKPSNPKVGGEVVVAGSGQGAGFTPTGFQSLGTINLTQGSTVDASAAASGEQAAGSVVIRGGKFVMDNSSSKAVVTGTEPDTGISGGTIEVTAKQVTLSNHSTIDTTATSSDFFDPGSPGHITFNVGTFSATDSAILAKGNDVGGGAVTIQGLQGSDTFSHSVSLTNTEVATSVCCIRGGGGPILLRGDNIALNQSTLDASAGSVGGGLLTLVSRGSLDIQNSRLVTHIAFGVGGTVDLNAGTRINLTGTTIDTSGGQCGCSITMAAPIISLRGSSIGAGTFFADHGGTISLTATKAVSLSGTILDASGAPGGGPGGTIQIDGGAQFTSQQSTIRALSAGNFGGTISLTATKAVSLSGTILSVDARGAPGGGPGGTIRIDGGAQFTSQQSTISAQGGSDPGLDGQGGTIHVDANKIRLTDTQLTTSTTGGPQTAGGSITVNAKNTILTNSQILSTATEGHGGTISLTGENAIGFPHGTVLSADGFNGGTVLINGGAQFTSQQSTISVQSGNTVDGQGGTIHVDANKIRLTDTQLTTSTTGGPQTAGGSITVNAKNTILTNSQILSTATEGHGGTISLTGENAIGFPHGTVLSADGFNGGTVLINGGAQFTSQQSTISVQSGNTVDGQGGTIHVDANKIRLTDTQLTTSTTGGPQTAGGSITVNAKNTTLTNSQILSTAAEGHGGTIEITSPIFHQHAGSVIDASSQSGTNGTVIINGVIQP